MGFIKESYKQSKKKFAKWKAEAPTRERVRIETAKRRVELERQRADIMKQKARMAKHVAETRKYSQQFRNSGFGNAMSTQPSSISSPSYFAQPQSIQQVVKRKVKTKKRRRK